MRACLARGDLDDDWIDRRPRIVEWTYKDHARIARFHLYHYDTTGLRPVPSHVELAYFLRRTVEKNTDEFPRLIHRLRYSCVRLASASKHGSTCDADEEFLLCKKDNNSPGEHQQVRGWFLRKLQENIKARKLRIFVRLGMRIKRENPLEFTAGIPRWRQYLDSESRAAQTEVVLAIRPKVNWEEASLRIQDREFLAPLALQLDVIGTFYDFEAPFHVFEALLQAKPKLVSGKNFEDLGYPGVQQHEMSLYMPYVQLHPARLPRADVYALLLQHGAKAEDGMLYHAVRYACIESLQAVFANGTCTPHALNSALRFHLEHHQPDGREELDGNSSLQVCVPIALTLLRYGADPTSEADKVLRTRLDLNGNVRVVERLNSFLDRCQELLDQHRQANNLKFARVTSLMDATRNCALMTTLCSACTVSRIGKTSKLGVLPVDTLRFMRVMLFLPL